MPDIGSIVEAVSIVGAISVAAPNIISFLNKLEAQSVGFIESYALRPDALKNYPLIDSIFLKPGRYLASKVPLRGYGHNPDSES